MGYLFWELRGYLRKMKIWDLSQSVTFSPGAWRSEAPFSIDKGRVVALGYFDGVHIGHQRIMEAVCALAEGSCCIPAVHTFSGIPISKGLDCVTKERGFLLTMPEEKTQILERCGIAEVFLTPFDRVFCELEPETFLDIYVREMMNAKAVVVGSDYRFGRVRAGDIHLLEAWGKKYDIPVKVVAPLCESGRTISSSWIRDCLAAGEAGLANRLLGYPISYGGVVEKGYQLGRTMQFPTANSRIESGKVVPKFGVYVSAALIGGSLFRGISNIGLRPTMLRDEKSPLLETMLYDVDADLYGKDIRVFLLDFVRPEMKFSSLDALKTQVHADMRAGREFHGDFTTDSVVSYRERLDELTIL